MSTLKVKNGNTWIEIPAGGQGVPSGGTTGQFLRKSSSTDYATEWSTVALGDVSSEDVVPILKGGTGVTTAPAAFSNLGGIRPNLLDNWYFVGGGSQSGWGTFPINQRGQTSYSGGAYAIDRWKLSNSYLTMNVVSGGITITNSSATSAGTINYTLPTSLEGKTVCASMLFSDGTLLYGSGVFPTPGSSNVIIINRSGNKAGCMLENHTGPTPLFTITANPSSSFTLVAVKLELGSSQTLAHQENGTWVLNEIPDFAEQLAKCQAYFVRLAGGTVRYAPTQITANLIDFTIPLPVTMRGTPTSSATLTASANMAVYINGAAQTGFTFSVADVDANAFCIRATKSAHGATGADVVLLNVGSGSNSPTLLSLEMP